VSSECDRETVTQNQVEMPQEEKKNEFSTNFITFKMLLSEQNRKSYCVM